MLNLARAVQGVGGAIMFATSLALIAAAFTGRTAGTAFGIYGAVIGGAVAIGPLIGGAITSGIGWRWIFFVNVPIGAVAILITFTQIAKSEDPRARQIDWVGLRHVLGAASSCWCSRWCAATTSAGAAPPSISLLVAAGRPHGGLLRQRALRRRPDARPRPVQDPGLRRALDRWPSRWRRSIFAMFLYLTLYIQDDLGYGPLRRRHPLPAR